jgi:hypothetical protein
MTKTTKVLLLLALAGLVSGLLFVSGSLNSGGLVALHVLLPMGAIFFGLFLLSKMLEKETAQYDEEQRANMEAASHGQEPTQSTRVESSPAALRAR